MSKYKRNCLRMAIVCFTIAAIALAGLVLEVSKCYAAGKDITSNTAKNAFYIQGDKDGSMALYTRIKDPRGLVVLYGVSGVTVNGKAVTKSKWITHSHKFLFEERPIEQHKAGSMNPLFPVWLSFMRVTTPQKTGKIATLVQAAPNQLIKIDGYIKVLSAEEWAICKRMRAHWEAQKKANKAKGQ